jgi:integrase
MAITETEAGTWKVDWYFKVDGKYKHPEKTFDRRKDALAFYESTRTKVRNREYVPPSKHLMKDVCRDWLQMVQPRVAVQTFLQYQSHVNNYIVPAFGEQKMTDVSLQAIEKAGVQWAADKEITAATVNKVISTLSRIYKWARKFGVNFNPVEQVDRQKENKSAEAIEAEALQQLQQLDEEGGVDGHLRSIGPHEVYNADQVRKLFQKSQPGLEKALHMTALLCGLRHGELNGLQWESVDFDKSRLLVRRSLTQLSKAKGGARLERPKSMSSYRYVPLPPVLVSELKKWKLQCPPNELDLIFVDELGRPRTRKTNGRLLKQAAIRAGIRPLSMHNLRHTFASQLLSSGREITEVYKLMGHHDPAVTLRVYAHWCGTDHSESASVLEAVYFG